MIRNSVHPSARAKHSASTFEFPDRSFVFRDLAVAARNSRVRSKTLFADLIHQYVRLAGLDDSTSVE